MGSIYARVKQWQKMGWPRGCNVGRGVKVDYTMKMIWEVALIAELSNLGVTPLIATEMVEANLESVMATAFDGLGGTVPMKTLPGRSSAIRIDVSALARIIERALSEDQEGRGPRGVNPGPAGWEHDQPARDSLTNCAEGKIAHCRWV